MTATSHALLGTVIAAKIGNPALAIPLAIASHIAADMIPHWDVATNRKTEGKTKKQILFEGIGDISLGLILSYLLIVNVFPNTNLFYALLVIIAAQGLDWLMAPYYFFKVHFPLSQWAYEFQKRIEHRLDKPWGIITQIATIIIAIALGKIL